jgi:FdhE protein
LGLPVGQTALILCLTLFPVLAAANAALDPLRQGLAWEHGYCPTCGGWPLLGEFRGLEQTRFLRCGLCAAEWAFPRLCCPFCGTREHQLLGYFHVEGEEGMGRASTCAGCRRYVKMTPTLVALSAPQLLVANAATLHLDLVADQRGYSRV